MTKKPIKIVTGLFLLVAAASLVLYFIYDEPLPIGEAGPQADALAHKMLKAINNEAFKDTRYLEWTFRNGKHTYLWDKAMGKAKVSWNDITVDLHLTDTPNSSVFEREERISDPQKRKKAIEKAIELFNNDSYWLIAPFKVFDKGVERKLAKWDDGSDALLVTYTRGGSTPGDSYLWKLHPNGFPISFKMWVKIIPIGGLEATWDDWQITQSGAFLPHTHRLGPITIDMGDVRGYSVKSNRAPIRP